MDISFKQLSKVQVMTKEQKDKILTLRAAGMLGGEILAESFNCTECRDNFSLKNGLTNHMNRKVQILSLSCPKCIKPQVFYNKCTFWLHLREHMQGSLDDAKIQIAPIPHSLIVAEPFAASPDIDALIICNSCGLDFMSWESLGKHLTQDRVAYKCPLCLLICPSDCSLKMHQKIHSKANPFMCPDCGIGTFKDFETFEYHFKMHCFHSARLVCYQCEICQACFNQKSALLEHIPTAHLNKMYVCLESSKYFNSLEQYKEHQKRHKCGFFLAFSCPFCKSFLSSIKYYAAHIQEHFYAPNFGKAVGFQCELCKQPFISKQLLLRHLSGFHNFSSCMYCQNLFPTEEMLSLHQKKCIARNCQSCTVDNLTGEDLIVHGRHHQSEHMWVCLMCNNKEFPTKVKLMVHLRLHTHTVYPHICSHCNQAYVSDEHLLLHLKFIHLCSGLTCHDCGFKFNSGELLENHLVHQEHGFKMYYCSVCNEFESPFLQDITQHVIEEHFVFADNEIKDCFKAKWIGMIHFVNEAALPPVQGSSFVPSTSDTQVAEDNETASQQEAAPSSPDLSSAGTAMEVEDLPSDSGHEEPPRILLNLGLVAVSYCKFCHKNFRSRKVYLDHLKTDHSEVDNNP